MRNELISRKLFLFLAILGLLIVLLSLAAFAYAAWPVAPLREQAPLVPTLFVPPS